MRRKGLVLFALSILGLFVITAAASAQTRIVNRSNATATRVYRKPISSRTVRRRKPVESQTPFSFIGPPKAINPSGSALPLLSGNVTAIRQAAGSVSATVETAPPTRLPVIPSERASQAPLAPTMKLTTLHSLGASWVEPLNPIELRQLAEIATQWIRQSVPDATTALFLAEPPKPQRRNPFTPALTEKLHTVGYAIAEEGSLVPAVHAIRYRVTSLDSGILVRLRIDALEISRYFERGLTGVVIAAAPTTAFKQEDP